MANVKPLRYERVSGNTIGFSELRSGETIAKGDVEPFAADDLSDVTIATPTAGQVLGYNGSVWQNIPAPDSLPDQTGQSGKYLTTNGTLASWATVEGGTGGAGETFNPFLLAGM